MAREDLQPAKRMVRHVSPRLSLEVEARKGPRAELRTAIATAALTAAHGRHPGMT